MYSEDEPTSIDECILRMNPHILTECILVMYGLIMQNQRPSEGAQWTTLCEKDITCFYPLKQPLCHLLTLYRA